MRHFRNFRFNSPDPDPLDGFEPIEPCLVDGDDVERCDYCNRPATLVSRGGWPCCTVCAETPPARERE